MNQSSMLLKPPKEFRRGEIWRFDPDPTRGREQAKRRPCVIISSNKLNSGPADLLIILPITSTNRGIPSHISTHAKGLNNESFIMCEQIRSVSKERMLDHIGIVEDKVLKEIEYWLSYFLELANQFS